MNKATWNCDWWKLNISLENLQNADIFGVFLELKINQARGGITRVITCLIFLNLPLQLLPLLTLLYYTAEQMCKKTRNCHWWNLHLSLQKLENCDIFGVFVELYLNQARRGFTRVITCLTYSACRCSSCLRWHISHISLLWTYPRQVYCFLSFGFQLSWLETNILLVDG